MDVYTEPAPHDKPERGQSSRFLKLLDPSAGGFTFQTFDDDRAQKNPALTRIVKSPPPARDELVKLNKQGAGVFVTINETDGSAANARTSRAFAQYGRKTTAALTACSRFIRRWSLRHRPDIFIDIGQ
jgi:hypothetical protein